MMKIKLLPSKQPSPKYIPYAVAVGYILAVIFAILAYLKNIYFLIGVVAVVIVSFIISRMFSWYTSAELRKTNKFLVYEVENIIGVLGRNKTRYDIYSVDKVEKRGTRLFVWGNIISHEPMTKAKNIKRVIIDDINADGEVLVGEYISR